VDKNVASIEAKEPRLKEELKGEVSIKSNVEDDESFCPRIHEKDREKGYVARTGELCVVFSDIATTKEKHCFLYPREGV